MKNRIPNNLNEFINESSKTSQFETSDLDDFLDFIDEIPDNIKSIDVQTEMDFFNPPRLDVKSGDKDWKETIKDIVKKAYKESKTGHFGSIELFTFNGYGLDKTFKAGNRYYIRYYNKKSLNFAKDMGSGKYGALD